MAVDLLAGFLNGATVELRSNATPVLKFSLQPAGGEPGALLRLLRPSVTLIRNGEVLSTFEPHGAPSEGAWLFLLGAAILLLGIFVWVVRAL